MKQMMILASLLFSQLSFAAPDTFKMYSKPSHTPNQFCDMYTKLSMDRQGSGLVVNLSNFVGGACEIMADPNPRDYVADLVSETCGTNHYEARDAAGTVVFRLKDHRNRECLDMVDALIEAEEIDAGGTVVPLFSKDN